MWLRKLAVLALVAGAPLTLRSQTNGMGAAAGSTGQGKAEGSLSHERTLIAEGDLRAAQNLLEAHVRTDPTDSAAHFLLGFVYFRQRDAKRSLAEYTLGAAGRRPTSSEFHIIGADYVLLGDFADADRWFTEATRADPSDASGWYLLGRAQYNEGDYAKAADSFRKALALHPQYIRAEDNLGLCLQALAQLAEAKAAFRLAIAWQQGVEDRSGAPYLDLGTLLLQEGDVPAAVESLRSAARLSPHNPKAHEQFGVALERSGDLQGARAELEQAAALAPKASPVHFELGQVYRRLGLKEEAKREFDLCSLLAATSSSREVPNLEGQTEAEIPVTPPSQAARGTEPN